ncbi:MAG: acylphosphatase [Alphaproteobacteria bacterium]|nr:acylphosphatase [Alphaproteobacteria bacterium]
MKRLRIRGRVQGVGYRYWAVGQARALGLRGWVRNRSDGSVEVVAAGPGNALDIFIVACRRGPRAARVEAVDIEDADETVGEGFAEIATL